MTLTSPGNEGAPSKPAGVLLRFFAGFLLLGQGFRLWGSSPKLMFLGALPALIVGAVYVAALFVLAFNLGGIAAWITPFASGWGEPWHTGTRILAALVILGTGVFLAIFTFAAVTLVVGDPFYERVWRHVENQLGGFDEHEQESPLRAIRTSIVDALRILLPTALIGIGLFLVGFVPVVGQILGTVFGLFFGGWFLVLELSGFAFQGRGLHLRDRRRILGTNRAGALGLGVATSLFFLIPLGAVIAMPAAVAAATLLSRNALETTRSSA